jgi:hypothetical protein
MPQHPLYSTRGEWVAMLIDRYIHDTRGEWIGWVDKDGKVFSVAGEYAGWLSKDFRVLRQRMLDELVPRRPPPVRSRERVQMPATIPLPPMMAELSFDTIDVFEEMPELLTPLDLDHLPDID